MTMVTAIISEFLRLRRSLALALVAAVPTCLALLTFVILLDRDKAIPWRTFTDGTAAIWAYLLLPMAATALSLLLAQVEQAARGWDHLLALPGWRGRFFLAKAVVLLLMLAMMSVLLVPLVITAGMAANAIQGGAVLTGDPAIANFAALMARMWVAAGLMSMLQLWLALRVRGFVPPLILGLGGTLIGAVAASARQGVYVPWLLPVNMLSTPDRAHQAMVSAVIGVAVLLPLMLVDLARCERA